MPLEEVVRQRKHSARGAMQGLMCRKQSVTSPFDRPRAEASEVEKSSNDRRKLLEHLLESRWRWSDFGRGPQRERGRFQHPQATYGEPPWLGDGSLFSACKELTRTGASIQKL